MRLSSFAATAALGLALASSGASAADMPARPIPAPAPAFTWTGFYSGISLGGITGDFDRSSAYTPAFTSIAGPTPAAIIPLDSTYGGFGFGGGYGRGRRNDEGSALVGSRSGYLHQFGMFVLGVETDTQVFRMTQKRAPLTFTTGALIPAPFDVTDSFNLHTGWQSSVRGRVGLAWDRFQAYATGGVAFTSVEVDAFGPNFPLTYTAHRDKSISGWTGGVGFEWAITDATSIGIEYRHTDYGRESQFAGSIGRIAPGGGPLLVPVTTRYELSNDLVMMTYHIRWGKIFPQFDWHL